MCPGSNVCGARAHRTPSTLQPMIESSLELREAWEDLLPAFGSDGSAPILVGGPLAERIGETIPIAIADEVPWLAVLGDGPTLDDGATVEATGLESAVLSAVVMLDAWRSPGHLAAVASEAHRILSPDGVAWFGRLDLDMMVESTPAARRSALLYGRHAAAIMKALDGDRSVAATELALMRRGFRPIESWRMDLPVAAFDDAASYLGAIEGGLWYGIDRIGAAERSRLLGAVAASLGPDDFPLVEYQPWVLASGRRPS